MEIIQSSAGISFKWLLVSLILVLFEAINLLIKLAKVLNNFMEIFFYPLSSLMEKKANKQSIASNIIELQSNDSQEMKHKDTQSDISSTNSFIVSNNGKYNSKNDTLSKIGLVGIAQNFKETENSNLNNSHFLKTQVLKEITETHPEIKERLQYVDHIQTSDMLNIGSNVQLQDEFRQERFLWNDFRDENKLIKTNLKWEIKLLTDHTDERNLMQSNLKCEIDDISSLTDEKASIQFKNKNNSLINLTDLKGPIQSQLICETNLLSGHTDNCEVASTFLTKKNTDFYEPLLQLSKRSIWSMNEPKSDEAENLLNLQDVSYKDKYKLKKNWLNFDKDLSEEQESRNTSNKIDTNYSKLCDEISMPCDSYHHQNEDNLNVKKSRKSRITPVSSRCNDHKLCIDGCSINDIKKAHDINIKEISSGNNISSSLEHYDSINNDCDYSVMAETQNRPIHSLGQSDDIYSPLLGSFQNFKCEDSIKSVCMPPNKGFCINKSREISSKNDTNSILHKNLYNQVGYICTVFNKKYIITYMEEAPILVMVKVENLKNRLLSAYSDAFLNIIYTKDGIQLIDYFPDGFEVLFDATLIPNTCNYLAVLIWNGRKPNYISLPYSNTYGYAGSIGNLPAKILFCDSHYLYINVQVGLDTYKTLISLETFYKDNECNITMVKLLIANSILLSADVSKFFLFSTEVPSYIFICLALFMPSSKIYRQILNKPEINYSTHKVYNISNLNNYNEAHESNIYSMFCDVPIFVTNESKFLRFAAYVSNDYIEVEAKIPKTIINLKISHFTNIMFSKGNIHRVTMPNTNKNEWTLMTLHSDEVEWINIIQNIKMNEVHPNNLEEEVVNDKYNALKEVLMPSSTSKDDKCSLDIQKNKYLHTPEDQHTSNILVSMFQDKFSHSLCIENKKEISNIKFNHNNKSLATKSNEVFFTNQENEKLSEPCEISKEEVMKKKRLMVSKHLKIDPEKDSSSLLDNHKDLSSDLPGPVIPITDRSYISNKSYNVGKIKSVEEVFLRVGKKLIVSRDKCFLYGVSLYSYDLTKLVTIGMSVEYEMPKANIASITQCWIGGAPLNTPEETYEQLKIWCRRQKTPAAILCSLLEQVSWTPDSLTPLLNLGNLKLSSCWND